MADSDTPEDTPAKKPARRRSTTPAKSAAAKSVASRTPRKDEAVPVAKKAKAPPKQRAAKRQAAPARRSPSASTVAKNAADKVGGKWGAAAIAGGLAVAGAATAALLSLRGSSSKPTDPAKPAGGKAHQPDGTDSSASFQAGIADENTVPDKK